MGERMEATHLDSQRLKAIAHPLRARVLAALRTDGPATASGLAARFATNSGQTSYHLRVLADAGLVEELTDRGTARERWWRGVHPSTHVDAVDDPGAVERRLWLRSEAAMVQDRAYARYLEEVEGFGPEWETVAGAWEWLLRLSPGELDELQHEIEQVVERYADRRQGSDATRRGTPGVAPVHVHLRAFPRGDVDGA